MMTHSRPYLAFVIALLLTATALPAADHPAKPKAATALEFVAITDDPKLPRVLLMGESVSIAYAPEVRKLLAGVANVHRVPANCGSTKVAVGYYGLKRWLPDANEKWDVIQFNHGLHDLSYRFADDRDKNDQGEYASPTNGGHQNVPPGEYEMNLRQIIARLKQPGAKLIFASTTPVPESDAAKYVKDSGLPYNEIAKRVMTEEGVNLGRPLVAREATVGRAANPAQCPLPAQRLVRDGEAGGENDSERPFRT
jgi:acyl-CoA thioesterase-1